MKLRISNSTFECSVGGRAWVGAVLCVAAVGSNAQSETGGQSVSGVGPKRTFTVVPRLSVTETFTDNVLLSSNLRQSEQITEISPGIRISAEGGRVKGYFDYALTGRIFAQNTAGKSFQQSLNSFGSVEAVPGFAFVDFSGSISQQAISALGAQSTATSNVNANVAETTALRVSPYFRGRLGSFADYEARYSVSSSRSGSAVASDSLVSAAQLTLTGRGSGGPLGWSLSASRQKSDYSAGRATEADSLQGSLTYRLTPQIQLSATGGRESNNYEGTSKDGAWISGFGVNWRPTDNTTLSATRQNRSFGESHNLSFEHRTPRTAWRLGSSRDVVSTPNQTGSLGLGQTYDLYFAQFASIEPDPVLRAALVNNFLQANGINPGGNVVGGFLTSAVSLQKRLDFSFSLLGLRDTITFIATQSEGSRLDTVVNVADDLANSAVVKQRGGSVSYAHRLTPQTSFNLLVSTQQSSSSLVAQDTTTNTVNLTVSTRVNNKTTAVVGARRVVSESAVSPFSESAVTGTLNVQF